MKSIEYSPDYKEKITEIRKYLDFQFGNRTREKIMRELDAKIHLLQMHENMGISVRDNYGVDCDYLCIYAVRNYIFYRVDDDRIYIVNIYNEREDFMQKMFGIKTTLQETEDYWDE